MLDGYLETQDRAPVIARKTGAGCFRIQPVTAERVRVRIRYFGVGPNVPKAKDLDGRPVAAASVKAGSGEGALFEVGKGIDIEFAGETAQDRTGPAVEISDVSLREDSRLTLFVEANDRSGVEKVSLFQDGKLFGEKTIPPFIWSFWPEIGYHTYSVVAVDRSANRNERRSDARTLLVSAVEKPDD